jgi:hypothetical protein
MTDIDDGSTRPFDVPSYDLRTGDWVACIIARKRQREPLIHPRLKPGQIVRVYRDPKFALEVIKILPAIRASCTQIAKPSSQGR